MTPSIRLLPAFVGVLILLLGLGTALVRLGWYVPLPNYDMLAVHGSLMVCGFLGTVICLERAVALGRGWGYVAPALTAIGGVWQALVPEAANAVWPTVGGSALLVVVFGVFLFRTPDFHTAWMALGAVAWVVGNVLLLIRWPLYVVVPWWIAFLLLTIAGERLELSRLLNLRAAARVTFGILLGGFTVGTVLTSVGFTSQIEAPLVLGELGDTFTSSRFVLGTRLIGFAQMGIMLWLLHYDLARRSVSRPGQTRFMAICLLSGYAWLGMCGLIGAAWGGLVGGVTYDAMLHSFFLGFVFSMIFGHALVILPAVAGVRVVFHRFFYLPLALLHGSLGLRAASDLLFWRPGRNWGGMLNVVSLLLFMICVVYAVIKGRRSRP